MKYRYNIKFQDPEEFLVAYDEMMVYIKSDGNQSQMEEELRGRGVSMLVVFISEFF